MLRRRRAFGEVYINTLYFLACQVRLPWASRVFVVSLVCRALLFPFLYWFYVGAAGLTLFYTAVKSIKNLGNRGKKSEEKDETEFFFFF